jgi:hypothetical protein
VDIYLGKERNRAKQDYFLYEKVAVQQNQQEESMYIDACEVHTGPAQNLPLPNEFKNCLEDDMETQCNIPHFVWSGRSTGKTPVGNSHAWKDDSASPEDQRDKIYQKYQAISLEMLELIKGINETFLSDVLDIELFSAEGDALHQLMDCVFMGPYARLDYGHRGHRGTLPVPSWSRNDKDTRDFDLPCTGIFQSDLDTKKKMARNYLPSSVFQAQIYYYCCFRNDNYDSPCICVCIFLRSLNKCLSTSRNMYTNIL